MTRAIKLHTFKAEIKIIGINPYVVIPQEILGEIFKQAGRDRGPIPITGKLNNSAFKQTLVKYAGAWRLYINTTMLKNSPKRIGEEVMISVRFDPSDRTIQAHPALVKALAKNKIAKKVFDGLPPSRRKEIARYISNLKTEESIARNIEKAISFLMGKSRFVGREKP